MAETAELHSALRDMLDFVAAGDGPSLEGPPLTELLRRIDALSIELRSKMPPMLQHYMERRSYTKALDFLDGQDGLSQPNC